MNGSPTGNPTETQQDEDDVVKINQRRLTPWAFPHELMEERKQGLTGTILDAHPCRPLSVQESEIGAP
jgi:hypothetical protein